MARRARPVDAVIIGYGWTGAIMAKTLTDAGLSVVALERGPARDTSPDFEYPRIVDELKHAIRGDLWQPLAKETVTVRHGTGDVAVPYRRYGSFVLGNGVGGAGVHWNGQLWRASPEDLRLRSHLEQRYGKDIIPEGMTIQDYPVSFEELEPHFDHFEKVCGVSGIAGNLRGEIRPGGNPFEGRRSDEFPTPPLPPIEAARRFEIATAELGYKSFPLPSANSSIAFTNPYGVRMGPCNLCGFCERFGCFLYSKASPQTTILPILAERPNLEVRTKAYVTRILRDGTGKKATGVLYVDGEGQEVEQPADLVIVGAFQMHNVRLLLLSGIGEPYDPSTGKGVVGKNYAYQMCSESAVYFSEDVEINPFIGAGAAGQRVIDEFNSDHFDHGGLGFVGGSLIYAGATGGRPIDQMMIPPDTPRWGSGWKSATTAADLGGFVRGAAKPGTRIITDGLKSYDALADSFRHYSIVQDGGEYADAVLPIVHVLFSNVKTWLNGTFHGVSAKHLPRYAREWNYRFNRRRRIADLTDFLLRRAATRPTITYRQLVDGAQINGALPASTG